MLGFDDRTVAEGDQVLALVRATPVRAGRTVVLQLKSAGRWRTVRTGTVNRRGQASFTIAPTLGRHFYRAVALGHRGAAPQKSKSVPLTATDVTPPAAPFGLVAVPRDGAVGLSWSRIVPADFDHPQVWMRTADTDWSLVTVTESDNIEVTLLQNGVTHWFTVASVDTNGNVSARAPEIAATPTASLPDDVND